MNTYTIIQIIGWIGALLVISAYFLVSSKRVDGSNKVYQWMNLIGAFGAGTNSWYQGAWPVLSIQVVWCIIALATLIKIRRS